MFQNNERCCRFRTKSLYCTQEYSVIQITKGIIQAGVPAVKLFHTELLHFDLKDTVSQLCNDNRALQFEN